MPLFSMQVHALWGKRAEPLQDLTNRWLKFMEICRKIDPLFDNWKYYDCDQVMHLYDHDFQQEKKEWKVHF